MANDRLRHALTEHGITAEQVAEHTRVDVKSVYRWLNDGVMPYPRHRKRIAQLLEAEITDLWPDLAAKDTEAGGQDDGAARDGDDAGRRVPVEVFASAEDPGAPDPVELIAGAIERVRLLDLTLARLVSPELVGLLVEKARAGVGVRVLVSHPESIHLTIVEAEVEPDLRVSARPDAVQMIEATLRLLQPAAQAGVEVRTFVAAAYSTLIVADGQMLITPHLYAARIDESPVMALDADRHPDLVAAWAGHYQRIWDSSRPAQLMLNG